MTSKQYTVRAVHCDHRASDEEVYRQLKRATAPLTRSWDRLRRAKTIAIKFNQDFPPHRVTMIAGPAPATGERQRGTGCSAPAAREDDGSPDHGGQQLPCCL